MNFDQKKARPEILPFDRKFFLSQRSLLQAKLEVVFDHAWFEYCVVARCSGTRTIKGAQGHVLGTKVPLLMLKRYNQGLRPNPEVLTVLERA